MDIVLKYFSEFTPLQLSQLQKLSEVYTEWNQQINVISRKDMDGLYEKHVLHSLAIAAVFNIPAGYSIIDLGTGGGFPGIPLAIFFPEVQFHLVDSIGKKLKVVNAVVDTLELKNVTTEHTRAEDIKNRQFDAVVSRAVAPLKDLLHWSRHLIKKAPSTKEVTGLICLKGGDLAQEISESGKRPRVVDIYQLFPEEYFREKYLLHVPR